MMQSRKDTTPAEFVTLNSKKKYLRPLLTILSKPPALPGRLPKFDISGNIRKPPIM